MLLFRKKTPSPSTPGALLAGDPSDGVEQIVPEHGSGMVLDMRVNTMDQVMRDPMRISFIADIPVVEFGSFSRTAKLAICLQALTVYKTYLALANRLDDLSNAPSGLFLFSTL